MNYSRQREAILSELRSRHDHPTADMIYDALKEDYPHISLGTIYRNLSLLCELGEIKKVSCDSEKEHYDGFVYRHDHFVCSRCGKIIDLEAKKGIADKPDDEDIAEVSSRSVIYYGLCRECAKDK